MAPKIFETEEISAEEREISSRRAFGHLLPLLKEHKRGLAFCLTLLAAATACSIFWPILLKRAIDVNIKNGDWHGLLLTALLIGLLQTVTIVFQYIQRVRLETIGQDVMIKLKKRLFDHILSLRISFFDNNPVGRLMARVESDTESLRQLFTLPAVLLIAKELVGMPKVPRPDRRNVFVELISVPPV